MANAKTTLPIATFSSKIVETVAKNPVTIITAETGAGKSTQVPQYLLDEGYNIVVTQPRILAARTVAERVAEEYGCEFGKDVGYRTASHRCDSEATRCLFVTDGLALVRELMGAGTHNCLILDEVHEWNLNIEVLVAWVKKQAAKDANFKVVLMSATLEAAALSDFFGAAPIIEVPGRTFPVKECPAEEGVPMHASIVELARDGRNVLAFQPGKAEIEATIKRLEKELGDQAIVLPLHGRLTRAEQRACFANYDVPKIVVSTNVAQTSVTIDDIDAVVDSGLERRMELVNGVEGLYLRPISLADAKQRKGRAGRVKAGLYIDHCPEKAEDRRAFPMAEVLRVRLDQTVLRLAIAGFDMEELTFFHQPDIAEIHEAKRSLRALGCMKEDGLVTSLGRAVSRLPISVQYARMIIEAEKLGVVDDVIKIAAILEQNGITARKIKRDDRLVDAKPYWSKLAKGESESDVIAQLNVYESAQKLSKSKMREAGIFVKDYYRAQERIRLIRKSLKKGKHVRNMNSSGKRSDILKAVCAGMVDHLYQKYGYDDYRNGDGVERRLGNESVVEGPQWVVGKPFDLEINGRYGLFTIHLVNMVTKVDPMTLAEVAPQLVKVTHGDNPQYDSSEGCVVSTTQTFFNGVMVQEETVKDPKHPEAPAILNEQEWKDWDQPEVNIPDFATLGSAAKIPEVCYKVYTESHIDGSPLTAYGVIYYSYGWEHKWVRDIHEAHKLHERSVKRLTSLQEKWAACEGFAERIARLVKRREGLGLTTLEPKSEEFRVGWNSYEYTDQNLTRFDEECEKAEAKRKEEHLKAEKEAEEARLRAEKEAEEKRLIIEEGALADFEAWCRSDGTNSGNGWVITPGGVTRDHDSIDCPRPRYASEGTKRWSIVRPEEVALVWSKATAAASHEFETVFVPKSGLTTQQRKTIENILEKIEEKWDGARGLASGKPSPSIREGWLHMETGESLTKGFKTLRQQRKAQEVAEQARSAAKSSPFAALAQMFDK